MRIQRARHGQEVFNKVDGAYYRIVQTGTGLSAMKIDQETKEIIPETEVELTEENAICFRLVNDPNPEPIPQEYSVENGKLCVDGSVVTEHGEIRVKRIIGVMPGVLVLAVEPRNGKEGEMDLFIYSPGKDRFEKILPAPIPDVTYMGGAQDKMFIGYSTTHTEKQEDEKAPEIEKFDSSAVICLTGKRVLVVNVPRPIILDEGIIEVPMRNPEDEEILVPFNKQVDEEGIVKDDKFGYVRLLMAEENKVLEYDEDFVTEVPVEATRCMLDDSMVLRSSELLIVERQIRICSPLLKNAEGYNYLVDITESRVDNCRVTTITLADEKYNVIKVIQKHTKDRGIVLSVE